MSSSLQAALNGLFLNDYASVVIITAVAYDYALTFFKEIEYIWCKPWTWVSIIFVFVRYCGLYFVVYNGLSGSSFFPGPIKLALFVLQVVSLALVSVIISIPKKLSVYCNQILSCSYCAPEALDSLVGWSEITTAILQVANGTTICTLAIVKSTRELLQRYRMTRRWELNQYMNLLIQQGVIYFVAILAFQLFNLFASLNKIPTEGWQVVLVAIVEYVPFYTLAPRFAISMRELYARDVRGGGVDSAFGLSASRIGVESSIMFAEVEQNGPEVAGETQVEVTEMEMSQLDPAV